ncbi:hypothetical protein HXZ91_04825 [Myroides odoratimimus]|uniref:hypothetical protein n=1 Tax=Myroides odoratimimus TaxID=76832 RepID=UPI00257630E5|nr:hypothetical protein [Myroides odoratimimus]MDM1033802.1 hypothetical protein [Myroides odoratimimus]
MENVERRVQYSNGRSIFDGIFHQWLKKVDEKGNEVSYALIEGVDGCLEELKYDCFKFVMESN